MNDKNQQKPCLVQTGQGFSVNYNGKFLYSKYNPAKAILQKIESLEILPGSVILCMSPVLGYGLTELQKKLPENCAILLCEREDALREISKLPFLTVDELYNLPVILQKPNYTFSSGYSLGDAGSYRRVMRIDFSAGVQFHQDFYNELEASCVNSIRQFWTNRITLSKFGRRFSRNLFRNLQTLPKTAPISNYIGKVSKPIVVFGSGESSEAGAEKIKLSREEYFVLCADTAFPMLKSYGVIPDGIVIDEAQSVVTESFIGAARSGVQIFQSLCSVPHVAGRFFPPERISFYATEYDASFASGGFFDNLKSCDFFPPVIPPFGSVGITAYFLANIFKSADEVPVSVYGLDFAYSAGKTHANGTPSQKRQLRETNRIKPVGNYGACFGANIVKIGIGGTGGGASKLVYSTPILRTYADTFYQLKNSIKKISSGFEKSENIPSEKSVSKYLKKEREALEELRDILSGKTDIPSAERDSKIIEICRPHEYLYLHFPDGYKFSMSLDFLKRVRAEIDFFLKYM